MSTAAALPFGAATCACVRNTTGFFVWTRLCCCGCWDDVCGLPEERSVYIGGLSPGCSERSTCVDEAALVGRA